MTGLSRWSILLTLTLLNTTMAKESKQPNLVVFLSDDHGYLDSPVYGSKAVHTPNMERLAKVGTVFTNAYVGSPSCAPSRAIIYTGLMSARNGAEGNHSGIRPGIKTLPTYLKKLGYRVALFGKQHLNPKSAYDFEIVRSTDRHGPLDSDLNTKAVEQWLSEHQKTKPNQPVCLFICSYSPHVYWPKNDGYDPKDVELPPTFVDTPETRKYRTQYYTDVSLMDKRLGHCYDSVRKHLSDDTLFLYTSDHGAQWPFGKWNLYDAGIRVPMIAVWPKVIKEPSRNDAMISTCDILPTFIQLAGGEVPKGLDGQSFASVLRGGLKHRDEIYATHSGDKNMNVAPMRCVRTPRYKYIFNLYPEFAYTTHIDKGNNKDGLEFWHSWERTTKSNEHAAKIVKRYHQRPREELYDVIADPHEMNNLATSPKHEKTLSELRAELQRWMKQQGDQKKLHGKPKLFGDDVKLLKAKTTNKPTKKPNVVFIFIDDMGYGDLSCFGNPLIKTKHIDKLASEGTRFTQFYVASPICSPSRVGVMTGQYPARHRIHSFLATRKRNNDRGMAHYLDAKVATVAKTFKNAGYATAHFGKWHMGGGRDVGDAPLPKAYGYDESLVSFEGLGDRVLPEGGGKNSIKLKRGKITFAPKHKLTEIYVNRSIDFIKRNKDKNFYLHLWLNDVHDAHRPSEEMLKKYERFKDNPFQQRLFAVMDEMDRQIGRLVKTIDDLGLDDDTLIVLTSDNGPTAWQSYERNGYDAPGSTGGMRGRKWSLYEGGIREPLIVRWKKHVPANQVNDTTIIGAVDLFPTFCSIANIKTPDVQFDGVDMSQAFRGKSIIRRKPLYWEYGRNDSYLKPAHPLDQSPNLAVRYDRWKLLMNADGTRIELYDLSDGNKEWHNVAGIYPWITQSLKEKLNAFRRSIPGYEIETKVELDKPNSIKLKAGQTVDTKQMPPVGNASIKVQATITAKGDGVILAHGGVAAGYALYVKDGQPTWAIRARNKLHTIVGKQKLSAGQKYQLIAELDAKRKMRLTVDGQQVAQGECDSLIPVQPVDPANVGRDDRGNVGDYQGMFKFNGSVNALSVTTQVVQVPAVKGRMATRWASDVDPHLPLPKYPRPQLVRARWLNLNGHWQYAIRPKDADKPTKWDGRIVVPFPIESQLSTVQKRVGKDNRLWYRRAFTIPQDWRPNQRVILNFGAVDWHTIVWLNGKKVGEHQGGYDPFSFDITPHLQEELDQEIMISVWDPSEAGPQPRGKQVSNPKGIWYTPVTGIWQTVWIEPVPTNWITHVKMTPDVNSNALKLHIQSNGQASECQVTIYEGQKTLIETKAKSNEAITIPINNAKLWSPESPFLYGLKIELKDGDTVTSYFGMRKIEIRKDTQGRMRLFLNGKSQFQYGPLDQGWWPDGLYTAPTDEALRYDIEVTKQLGFNMIRKHVKVEPARWYYHCDKLGILVWQDMPSAMQGGGRGPNHVLKGQPDLKLSDVDKQIFRKELKSMIDSYYNHPSIVVWVPFNEGWGQHGTNAILKWTKEYDPSRLVDGPSGWEDRGYGDMKDLHRYPGPAMFPVEKNRASILGEFGGLGLPIEGHLWLNRNNWGYRTYKTQDELQTAYANLMKQMPALINDGLAAAIYTQTTDVEVEVNGLMTYDRAMIKLPSEWLHRLHRNFLFAIGNGVR